MNRNIAFTRQAFLQNGPSLLMLLLLAVLLNLTATGARAVQSAAESDRGDTAPMQQHGQQTEQQAPQHQHDHSTPPAPDHQVGIDEKLGALIPLA